MKTFQQTLAAFILCLVGVAQAQLEAHCIMDGTNGVGELTIFLVIMLYRFMSQSCCSFLYCVLNTSVVIASQVA